MLTVRLGRDLEKKLSDLSQWTGRSKEYLVKETLQYYLEEVALYYQAVRALKEYEESGEKSYPAEEVWKRLGLENNIDEEG